MMSFWRILFKFLLTLSICVIVLSQPLAAPLLKNNFAAGKVVDFTFESHGVELSGVFDVPSMDKERVEALILFVHGYGTTDVRGWNMYTDLRKRFTEIGIATATWDKPGQGLSKGIFDINQSVYESASEIVDAAKFLRALEAPGAHKIGIWGISRAGWIVPIAMSQDRDIKFWISVSGVTAEDNFPYLLLSNLPYEGGSFRQAMNLASEWRKGCEVLRMGGSYDTYLMATAQLRSNAYIKQMRGDWLSRAQFKARQRNCRAASCKHFDDDMCSYIFIEGFDHMLSSFNIDVLALFGQKDLNVDWQKTHTLYKNTIGQNPEASLSVHIFPDADHNLHITKTGSLQEMKSAAATQKSKGYYDVQISWLQSYILKEGSKK